MENSSANKVGLKSTYFSFIICLLFCQSCNETEKLKINITDNVSVFAAIPKHCQYYQILGNGIGLSGLEFACPFEYKNMIIQLGIDDEIISLSNFEEINADSFLKDLNREYSKCKDLFLGTDYFYFVCYEGSRFALFYERHIKVKELILQIRITKGVDPDNYTSDLNEILDIGSSITTG